jgi:trimethylamine:corrinoid methyltransferase-like protein
MRVRLQSETHGRHFLGSRNTRKAAHSDEFFMSELIDRHPYEAWMKLGKPSMYLNAREKVKSVLAAPLADPLPENVLKTLDDILAAADKELG